MTPLILFSLTSFPVGNFQLCAKVDVLVGLGTVLCVIFIILLVRAAMRGTVALRKTTHQAWQTAADDLGLAYQPADRSDDYLMEGTMAGFQVKVESTFDTHRQGAETKQRTAFTVDFPESLGLGLELTWQIPLIGGISKFFGAQDIVPLRLAPAQPNPAPELPRVWTAGDTPVQRRGHSHGILLIDRF